MSAWKFWSSFLETKVNLFKLILYFVFQFLPFALIIFTRLWFDNAAYTSARGMWLWYSRYPNRRNKKLESNCIIVYPIS